jgi:hypothetical protein
MEDHPRERGGATEDRGELVEALRCEDEHLRRQLDQATERDRENRCLLAAALERIPPQLETSAEEGGFDIGEAPNPPTYRARRRPSDGNLAAAEEHLAAPFR